MRNSVWARENLEDLDQSTLSDPHQTSEEERHRLLQLVLRTNVGLLAAMKGVRSLQLPDWCVYGPSIVWPLWSAFKGPPKQAGNHQLYVAYYDAAPRAELREAQYLHHLRQILSSSPYQLHLANQAHAVIRTNQQDLAENVPVRCTEEALVKDPVRTYAVGVRLEANDSLTVLAPLGLSSMFSMRMQRNPGYCLEELFQHKLRRVQAMWPGTNFR